jgi:hypothetical protein
VSNNKPLRGWEMGIRLDQRQTQKLQKEMIAVLRATKRHAQKVIGVVCREC